MKYERGSFITVGSRDTLRGLHPTAQTLYMWLSSYANETGNCFPSRKTLAEDCGCSERTIDTMIDSLIEKGLLEVKGRKDGDKQLSNLYKVLIVPPLAGGATPPSTQYATPLQNLRTNSNQLTKTNEVCELASEVREVYEVSEEDRPVKKESRVKDKLAIYHLFSQKEQPWWRHAQQKKAALSLFDLIGVEKVRAGLELMRENEDDKYCPQAATPFQYEEKLPALAKYAKRNSV